MLNKSFEYKIIKKKSKNRTQYRCNICPKTSNQRCHHEKHISYEKHKLKVQLKKLELEKMTEEELNQKYNSINIDEIIKDLETEKIINYQEIKLHKIFLKSELKKNFFN